MQNKSLLCAAIAVILTIAGCSEDTTATPSPTSTTAAQRFPNLAPLAQDMRFHWSAEPGIDLFTGPAVPIRAYSESFYIINLLADPDAGYPGFARAISVPPDQVGKPRFNNPRPQGTSVISNYGDYVNKPLYGTMYLHIMRITPTPTGFSTLVCDSRDGLYLIGPDGKYVPRWKSTSLGPAVVRIDFTNQSPAGATAPSSPTAPQRGPLPAPAEDVFGEWIVTGRSALPAWVDPNGQYSDDPETDALKQQCANDIQTPGLQLPGPVLDKPPPPPAPVPGWPTLPG